MSVLLQLLLFLKPRVPTHNLPFQVNTIMYAFIMPSATKHEKIFKPQSSSQASYQSPQTSQKARLSYALWLKRCWSVVCGSIKPSSEWVPKQEKKKDASSCTCQANMNAGAGTSRDRPVIEKARAYPTGNQQLVSALYYLSFFFLWYNLGPQAFQQWRDGSIRLIAG